MKSQQEVLYQFPHAYALYSPMNSCWFILDPESMKVLAEGDTVAKAWSNVPDRKRISYLRSAYIAVRYLWMSVRRSLREDEEFFRAAEPYLMAPIKKETKSCLRKL